ncbi:AhpD-like protein [Hyaloraphidium curvatum]|nr:AhpD-like protein [Hyaloraphidium curvatum]
MPKTAEDGLKAARAYRDAAKKAGANVGLGTTGVNGFLSDRRLCLKIVPDLRDLTRNMVWSQIYSRDELSMRQRSIVILSCLITQGVEAEIEIHVHTGLNVGLSANDIVNLMVNLFPYVGFPRTLNALKVAAKAFKERGLSLDDIGRAQIELNAMKPARGAAKAIMREYRDAITASGGKIGMAMPGGSPHLKIVRDAVPHIREVLEATSESIYARPGFSKKDRSLTIVSSLLTQGNESELSFHTDTALNVGLTPAEVLGVGVVCVGYVGFPKSLSGLRAMALAMEKRGVDLTKTHAKL